MSGRERHAYQQCCNKKSQYEFLHKNHLQRIFYCVNVNKKPKLTDYRFDNNELIIDTPPPCVKQ